MALVLVATAAARSTLQRSVPSEGSTGRTTQPSWSRFEELEGCPTPLAQPSTKKLGCHEFRPGFRCWKRYQSVSLGNLRKKQRLRQQDCQERPKERDTFWFKPTPRSIRPLTVRDNSIELRDQRARKGEDCPAGSYRGCLWRIVVRTC